MQACIRGIGNSNTITPFSNIQSAEGLTIAPEVEQKLLRQSVYVALFFAALGVVWGLAINSSVIIFDGLYSFVSMLLTSLSLVVAKQLDQPEDHKFQFGRAMLEPLVIAFKSMGIAVMCAYAFFSAIDDLLNGGVDVPAGWGIGYAVISTLACFLSWRYILRRSRNEGSELIRAEADQWYMDMMLSGAVLIGFVVSYLLGLTSYSHWPCLSWTLSSLRSRRRVSDLSAAVGSA